MVGEGQGNDGSLENKTGKNKKGKKTGKKNSLLDQAAWKSLPSASPVLGGLEGGFMSLEVMDDPEVMAALYPEAYGKGKGKKSAKTKGKKGQSGSEGDGDAETSEAAGSGKDGGEEDDVGSLKAKLAALERENKQLKKEKRREKQEKRKQDKKRKRAAAQEGDANGEGKPASADEAGTKEEEKEEEEPPLVDTSAWDDFDLHPGVQYSLARLGFPHPTSVQAECLPSATRDRLDIIGAAQTGSGKTLAFGLPIMQRLMLEEEKRQAALADDEEGLGGGSDEMADGKRKKAWGKKPAPSNLRALVLAPTRELAMQVCSHLKAVGSCCGVAVVPIVGGLAAPKQERLLRAKPAVVVATPGRLWDLIRRGDKHLLDMRELSFLVIDEADRMMQHGQYAELSSLLDQIQGNRATGQDEDLHADERDVPEVAEMVAATSGESDLRCPIKPPQLFVFSATLTLPKDMRRRLRKGGGGAGGNSASLESLMDKLKFRGRPKVVDLTSERKVAEKVQEAYVEASDEDRDNILYYLLAAHPGKTIVFANAISAIRRLAALLSLLSIPAAALHAGMQQRARLKALDRFAKGDISVLVASDVAARGLDVKDVRCVVHYQLPASVDIYVHRSGRTARADADGLAVSLIVPKERGRFLALQRALDRDPPPEFPVDSQLMPGIRDRVKLAVKLDELDRRQKKAKTEMDWAERTARELEIDLDDDGDLGDDDQEADAGRKKKKKKAPAKAGAKGTKGLLTKQEAARAAAMRRELNALLADPLTPRFNPRFFAGQADASPAGEGGSAQSSQQGPAPSLAMAQKVASAKQQAAAAAISKKSKKKAGAMPGAVAAGAVRKMSTAAIRAAAIKKALDARQGKKSRGGKGMVVIPPAFGRDASRPDALSALRSHMGSR